MPSRWIGGLDEAGRGSWIGPLVVGAFRLPRSEVHRLRELGVRDSKMLSPLRRAEIARRLAAVGEIRLRSIPPRVIDRWVARHGLNEMEIHGFATLIRGWEETAIVADACDVDPERFAERLRVASSFAGEITARHHADRTDLVVGAASIVAKVCRDRAIERLLADLGSTPLSGYPSDPRTEALVRSQIRPGGPWPPWIRRSWKTTERVLGPRGRTTLDHYTL